MFIKMNSSYAYINKIECGSTMDDFGNTCFFNSLMKCLKNEGKMYSYSYRGLLEFGAWNYDKMKGKMVDTLDIQNIHTLAVSLNVRIAIYTEIMYNVVNVDSVIVLGRRGPVCRIVKVKGFNHFNMMTFKDFNPVNVENAALGVALNMEQTIKKGKEAEDSKAAKVKNEMAATIVDIRMNLTEMSKIYDEMAETVNRRMKLAEITETINEMAEIANRRMKLAEMAEIANRRMKLDEKEKKILEFENEITNRRMKLAEEEKKILELENEIVNRRMKLDEKEKKIMELGNEIDGLINKSRTYIRYSKMLWGSVILFSVASIWKFW